MTPVPQRSIENFFSSQQISLSTSHFLKGVSQNYLFLKFPRLLSHHPFQNFMPYNCTSYYSNIFKTVFLKPKMYI